MSTNGHSWVSFVFDGTTHVLPYANINSWDQRPIYAEDGYTLTRIETTISGSALVSYGSSTYSTLGTLMRTEPGRVDFVSISVDSSGGTEQIYSAQAPDALRGPLMSMTVTEIAGRQAAMVTFTIVGNAAGSVLSQSNSPIMSHRWVQSFSLDAAGHLTRTVTGSLTVDLANGSSTTTPSTGNSSGQISGKAPWADIFRKAILPTRPNDTVAWRRESQTFAYNEAGNALIYTIVDTQARMAVPDAALTGNCDFTYERSRQDIAFATLRFNCDLEGPWDGDLRNMIWSAVVLAQSRIPFNAAMIDRMVVQEQEMMTRAKIRFEVTARCYAFQGDPEANGVYPPVPLANLIGKYFKVTRSCPEFPDAYGGASSHGVAGVPHWYNNDISAKLPAIDTSLPVATLIAAITAPCTPGTPTIVMTGDDSSLDSANTALNQGPFRIIPLGSQNAANQPNGTDRAQTVTSVFTDTKMHRLNTLYTEGSDFVFQIGKPSVTLEEVTTVKTVNKPPARVFRPMPSGFMCVKDDWKVNFGEIDPNGHRTFIGVYTRTLKSYDLGGTVSNGYFTNGGRRQWWPPSGYVTSPLALGFDTSPSGQDDSQSVFHNVGGQSTKQGYSLGNAQAYV